MQGDKREQDQSDRSCAKGWSQLPMSSEAALHVMLREARPIAVSGQKLGMSRQATILQTEEKRIKFILS